MNNDDIDLLNSNNDVDIKSNILFSKNLSFNGELDELEEQNLIKDALLIYHAIKNNEVDLSSEEKNDILNEINAIFNHFDLNPQDYKYLLNNDIHSNNQNNENSEKSFNDSHNSTFDDLYIDENSSNLVSNDLENFSNELSSSYKNDLDKNNDFYDLSVDDALNDIVPNFSNEVAIKVQNVSMQFNVSKDKIDTLKEFIIRTIKRNKSDTKTITALNNVSFEIPKGDRVGIIGFNGAGKSTLLKVLAGVYDATEGTIETKGKIAPLLELGAGFDNNYTGKDNIFLNGAFLGYSEDFLKEKYDEILEFSELGDSINYHVKTYSSGMRAKLGFSIATIVEPDILILDEILSVGDIKFRKKSADKIRSLINSGITVLLVSHSVAQIRDLCNKAIWIDNGELKMYGDVNEVCDAYVKAATDATKDQLKNIQLN